MSLASPVARIERTLDEQAHALLVFLSAHGHKLAVAAARTVLTDLDSDAKPAAKQLRAALAVHGIDIKHTHALSAVAKAREAEGFLGLGGQQQYVIASWYPDAPGVSAERVTLRGIAKAADEVCRRVREQFEDDPPLLMLRCAPCHVRVEATSAATGAWWNMLLVPIDANSRETTFKDYSEVERLAERLRRLAEGELGGWLDGAFEVSLTPLHKDDRVPRKLSWTESQFADQIGPGLEDLRPYDMPRQVPSRSPSPGGTALTQDQWARFLKRYEFFARRQDQPLFRWAKQLRAEADQPRFEPVRVDVAALERARQAANASWADIAAHVSSEHQRSVVTDLQSGQADLAVLLKVAGLLNVARPNELLAPARAKPRIPLPRHTDIGLWLSRLEAMVEEPVGAPQVPAGLVDRMKSLCAIPQEQRRRWGATPPPELEALNQEIRFAGLLVCAGMGVRFVQDLPMGLIRPASVSILEFDRQIDVLTQSGHLGFESRSMDLEPERDAVTPEWLARFNKPSFSANELLKFSDMAQQHQPKASDPNSSFTAKVFAGTKVFKKDPHKAHAAMVRMEALSSLSQRHPMEPWIHKGRDSSNDSLVVTEAAFEAAARCEITDVEGSPGFDPQTFYMLCVRHARKNS